MNDDKESILNSVKSLLGIKDPTMTAFDTDIILYINSALATLTQLGVGPSDGFVITGESETYRDFLGDDRRFQMVKIYLVQKVKLGWDPPQTSALMQTLKEEIKEKEWRLNTLVDPPDTFI